MISRAQFTIIKNYDGDPGSPGASVQSVVRQFTISTSYNELVNVDWEDPNTPEWSTTEPNDIDADHYLWERFQTTLSDGTIVYSNAVCQRTISGVISRVNEVEGSITNKVWQTDITNSINSYDSNTTSTIRNRVSSVEQTINGYDVIVSGETTHVDGLSERMTSAEGRIFVTEGNVLIQATQNDTAAQAGQHIIESFINVAPSNIRISADRINFEGSAVFSSFVTDQDLEAMQTDIEQYARNLTSDMATNTSVSNTYATKTTAIKRSQRIYKQTNQVDANNNPVVPDPATDLRNPSTNLDTWVATNVAVYDTWTTKRMSYSRDYPYIWTCEQRETVSGELAYTPVLLDDTTTVIDGGSIITNSIAANRIIAHSITSNELATNVITSSNYSPPTGDANNENGTYPYSVLGTFLDLSNGNITSQNFVVNGSNAYFRGTIETGEGNIGGFTITENSIYHNKRDVTSVDLSDDVFIISNDPYVLDQEDYLYGGYATLYEVYMGVDGISCGFGKFAVDSTGELFASNATIKGNITATSGSFGSTNGLYEINNNGLVGYKVEIIYYFEMMEILNGTEYNEGSVQVNNLEVKTSNQNYSHSDILNIDGVVGIDLKEDNDKLIVIIRTDSSSPISSIFNGTITDITCSYSYNQSGTTRNGIETVTSWTGLSTPSSETVNKISGTELGYDFLKTDELIANGGTIGGLNINDSNIYGGTRSSYDSGTGFFLDSNGNFGLGSNSNYIVFNGSNLNIKGSISTGSKVNAQDTTNNGTYIDVNGNMATSNIIAHGGKIGNWTISNGILTASGTWEDYQDWDWSYTMDIQPGSFDMSYYVLRDEEGNTVPKDYYAGHTSIENDYISLFSQSSGSPSDETILRPGDISTTYITTYQISSSLSSDLIISSNDSTWSCRLTQYGNFRPGGIDSVEDSQATGQQLLGTKDNRWKQVYVTTAENVNSDIKTKDNIEEIDFSETLIRNLKPVSFMLKNSDHRRKHMGFIAQDVSQLCKDIGENLSVVSASYKYEPEGGKEYFGEDVDDNLLSWGITYDELIAPMVLEIQKLMDRVDKLEHELNELKGVNR